MSIWQITLHLSRLVSICISDFSSDTSLWRLKITNQSRVFWNVKTRLLKSKEGSFIFKRAIFFSERLKSFLQWVGTRKKGVGTRSYWLRHSFEIAPAATGNDSGSHRYWLRQLLKKDLQYKVKTICSRWNVTFHHNQLFNTPIQYRWQVKAMVEILPVGMKKQRYDNRKIYELFQ